MGYVIENKEERAERFAQWLKDRMVKWMFSPDAPTPNKGQYPNQQQFAKYLGVNSTSLSFYLSKERYPSEASAQIMADKLGPEAQEILGYPQKLPNDSIAKEILKVSMGMSAKLRKEYLERGKDMQVQEETRLRTLKQQARQPVQS